MVAIVHRHEFVIQVREGETFPGLVAAGKYERKWDVVIEGRFPVRPTPSGERRIVLLNFGRRMHSDDVIAEAVKLGLVCPTYEDCLRFGAQHPEQRQLSIIFLHEPVKAGKWSVVLALFPNGNQRDLGFGFADCSDWYESCWFAFVQP